METWIREIHNNAVAHGFWDERRSTEEIFNLMYCEIAESVEEHRKGISLDRVYYSGHNTQRTDAQGYTTQMFYTSDTPNKGLPAEKPEGVFIELVDCAIRALDYIGSKEQWIRKFIKDFNFLDFLNVRDVPFNVVISNLNKCLHNWQYSATDLFHAASLVRYIEAFINANGGNFLELIELKHLYNKSRPHKHGKRY